MRRHWLPSTEATELRRELVKGNRAAYLPDLAASLNNLANRLAEDGQREKAIAVKDELDRISEEVADLRNN